MTPDQRSREEGGEILPDGGPLELLILADTSASMDRVARRMQDEFVAAILGSLTPKDRVNLGVYDVDCRWVFARPAAADGKNVASARRFLAARDSLGWTDLDRTMQAALEQCGPKTHVIFLGNGIVTAGDGDPAAFVKRLRALAQGKSGTFHAVAVGANLEPGVLQAITSLGGGSVRRLHGLGDPELVARDLLAEIMQPALRDVKLEFRGMRTARVYPASVPNLPPGAQQLVLGRYLPEPRSQQGEVTVTATRAGKPVRFSAKVSLAEGQQGNPFIPRLWAQMYLDALSEQAATPALCDEIIATSQRYHVLTPYTSLVVLESRADWRRFHLARRFSMSDADKFFAAGRDKANWERVAEQKNLSGAWRLEVRRRALEQLGDLGRDSQWIAFLSDTLLEPGGGTQGPGCLSASSTFCGVVTGARGTVNFPDNSGTNVSATDYGLGSRLPPVAAEGQVYNGIEKKAQNEQPGNEVTPPDDLAALEQDFGNPSDDADPDEVEPPWPSDHDEQPAAENQAGNAFGAPPPPDSSASADAPIMAAPVWSLQGRFRAWGPWKLDSFVAGR